ncbi:ERV/ALR sulfhydryl oxidase domain-containing protein [Schizophyllum fasciatum]
MAPAPETQLPSSQTQSQPLPPGMIMGPDGKPCKICTAFRDWKPPKTAAAKSTTASSSDSSSSPSSTSSTSSAAAAAVASLAVAAAARRDCPPDVEVLGRATWTFLHTTAAYYPERPTARQRAHMLSLIHAIPVLYPCSHCAGDFDEDVKVNPPDVSSRGALSLWMCERHNAVNAKLGRTKFDCAIESTDARWKDGPADGSCD